VRDSFLSGATVQEAAVLLEVAKARRLNPITKQIHFVKRWDKAKGREVWSSQTSIDGLRAIAERTGLYAGQDEAELIFEGKQLVGAKVRVYRKDWERPAVGVAWWMEFVPINTKTGMPTHMWQQMPRLMISKCAEALALRKAFPEDTSGLYIAEEMHQAVSEREQEEDTKPNRRAPPPPNGTQGTEKPTPQAAPEDAQIVPPVASNPVDAFVDELEKATAHDEVTAIGERIAALDSEMRRAALREPYRAALARVKETKLAAQIAALDVPAREPGEDAEPTEFELHRDRFARVTTQAEFTAARKLLTEARDSGVLTPAAYRMLSLGAYEDAKKRIGGR
ncbi:MAG: phage recombination protein Bet, partial [Patescibacteria group bacterium]